MHHACTPTGAAQVRPAQLMLLLLQLLRLSLVLLPLLLVLLLQRSLAQVGSRHGSSHVRTCLCKT
jgi:hypothetical protein